DPHVQGLDGLANALKRGVHDVQFITALADDRIREELLDADLDLAWVSFGASHSMGAQTEAGWELVNTANMGKVDPATVKAFRDANGKITKPAGWTAPDHRGLV